MENRELYLIANDALKNAYAPYSGFAVGAAVLTESGEVFTGVNIENSSYPVGLCAERSAFAAAISAGHRDFTKIAVCTKDGSAWPCGMCRQFMYEFSPDIEVISGEDAEHIETYSLTELLKKGFALAR